MYALFTLGPSLEHYYGHVSFLLFYLVCGYAGNVVSFVASPATMSVGASTALFGLVAAQGMFFYKNRRILRNYQKALQNIGFVIILNLLLGLRGGIDNWGHLGGLLCGTMLSYLCGPELKFYIDPDKPQPVLVDTVSSKRRWFSYALVTLFFTALAIAFGR